MGGYSAQATEIVNAAAIAIANWSTAIAVDSIKWLLGTLGQSTEPDLTVIVPVYDRMLAISLLLVGAVVALALIERIAWGSLGTGLALIPRVVAASFAAYAGLGLVKYVTGYAALLATTWSPDFTKLSDTLIHNVAVSDAVAQSGAAGAHVSTFGLIVTALSLSSLTVMVHLELVVRSALILTISSFVPLVCVLSIWPLMASTASTMGEFLIGLLLSKFVVATAVYVGFRLVVVALISPTDTDTTENWMASGVAVLLIAAFSPIVIFSALRFAHSQAGSAARNLTGAAASMAPAGRLLGTVGKSLRPVMRSAQKRLDARIKRLRPRQ
ncbi:MAG: hypothetical protein ACYDA0_11115 [Candidatus Dormibacteraceae bacterium]